MVINKFRFMGESNEVGTFTKDAFIQSVKIMSRYAGRILKNIVGWSRVPGNRELLPENMFTFVEHQTEVQLVADSIGVLYDELQLPAYAHGTIDVDAFTRLEDLEFYCVEYLQTLEGIQMLQNVMIDFNNLDEYVRLQEDAVQEELGSCSY